MARRVNVLITGAGGNLAVFIWRALGQSRLEHRIVAADYSHDAVGLFRAERGYVVPPASDPGYLPRLLEVVREEQIDIVMVGGMAEMRELARHADRIKRETGAHVVTAPHDVLTRAEDKYELAVFLRNHGFDHPRSVLPGDGEAFERFLTEVPLPYVVKDRLGGGSQGLAVVRTREDLEYHVRAIPRATVQEYLAPDDEEFTVGCFVESSGRSIGHIVMKRQLGLGLTSKARVLHRPDIGRHCDRIVEKLGLVGPSNLQLRLTERGPVVFEINPRFSSTESARAYYGFNAPEMCIRHFVLGESLPRPAVTTGRFFRVIDDVFVDDETFEEAERSGRTRGARAVIRNDF